MLWQVPMLPENRRQQTNAANKNRLNKDAPNFNNVRLNLPEK